MKMHADCMHCSQKPRNGLRPAPCGRRVTMNMFLIYIDIVRPLNRIALSSGRS
jgi:hypothetical protein